MSQAPRKSNRLFLVVVIVLVAALAIEAALLLRPKQAGRPATQDVAKRAEAIASGPNEIETFGQATAPIKIEFYAPLVLEWHKKTIGLLREYDQQHPRRILVKLMPMGNSACDEEMTKRGFTCAVIFVNGQHEFALPNGKKVDLQKKPNTEDSFYNSEDVTTVLDHLKVAPPKPSLLGQAKKALPWLAVIAVIVVIWSALRRRPKAPVQT